MSFLWPQLLFGLAAVPLLAALYAWWVRRRRAALGAGWQGAVGTAAARRPWWRHLPAALMLGALALLVVAAARPAAVLTLPSQHETVMLAVDVSGSMRATDI